MRERADDGRIRALARALGQVAPADARLYLTGGASAVVEGWRESTLDIDVRIEPESDAVFHRLAELKEELSINIEFASPPDFIPELPGWRERSPFLFQEGRISVHHFDPYSQAISKVERNFDLDREDVEAMLERGMIERGRLVELFEAIAPQLYRYPAIDAEALRERIERVAED